jgi:hypothetical protein
MIGMLDRDRIARRKGIFQSFVELCLADALPLGRTPLIEVRLLILTTTGHERLLPTCPDGLNDPRQALQWRILEPGTERRNSPAGSPPLVYGRVENAKNH